MSNPLIDRQAYTGLQSLRIRQGQSGAMPILSGDKEFASVAYQIDLWTLGPTSFQLPIHTELPF